MANVRIAQIGQVRANRPIYEIALNGRKFAAIVNYANQVEFAGPAVIRSLGISSIYADTLERSLNAEIVSALGFTGSQTFYDSRFPYQQIGTGLAYVTDFLPYLGWKSLNPVNFVNRVI
ncbi:MULTISPECIES: hypothetical protein [unclassified Spirosoma]|uniref:hypothetical protein n=1 Tax=unclassified Spirosoma TaxID=2621999 RepID=UPI00096158C8|nr:MULTISPECIES: hypothetical protein [unclassified Spirosoma]MBN8823887.1 hypothetical protein [Spirosoma sp.]OJW79721.1 MAG: hypothetical protein BGO59_00260 [Spirosoma sp. 48-14]